MDREHFDEIATRLALFKESTNMTYWQIANEIDIEGITGNVVAHLSKHEECASEKAEAIGKWLEFQAKSKELARGNEYDDYGLGEMIQAYEQMEVCGEAEKNPQGLTALRQEERAMVTRMCELTELSLKDAASNYVEEGDWIMRLRTHLHMTREEVEKSMRLYREEKDI